MKIAIPSYKRVETLKNKTLKLLKEYSEFDDKEVYIFVANKEELEKYKKEIKEDYNFIVGKPGIKNIRNFMVDYFKEGEKVFYMDDDLEEVLICKYNKDLYFNYLKKNNLTNNRDNFKKLKDKGNYLEKIDSIRDFINYGFNLCEKRGLSIFGIYFPCNSFFMTPKGLRGDISFGLNYILAGFYGVINNKKIDKATIDDKEDIERSIHFFLKDKGVIRFNYITMKTDCYKGKGGMQEERTKERIFKSAYYLSKKYPDLCKLNLNKKSGFAEVRFKRNRKRIGRRGTI